MSGGVDSSVAAAIIKNAGFDCVGVTMKLYGKCFSQKDALDAKAVAARLGFSHEVIDFTGDFRREVIDKFASVYANGGTPNPCIDCNKHIKFRALLEYADSIGCHYVVTGHYARIEQKDGLFYLKKGADETKDQSYVLYSLTQDELSRTLLPLGSMSKSEARDKAAGLELESADKKESQDICFVPDGDYASFIEKYLGKEFPSGEFVDIDGNVLGRHRGIIRYTIGQRKGLGLALPAPLYVCEKRISDNRVVLAPESELFSDTLYASDFNWIIQKNEPFRAKVKTRYRAKEADATVTPLENGRVKVVFDLPQRAITRAQAAVVYIDDTVIGGGTIE